MQKTLRLVFILLSLCLLFSAMGCNASKTAPQEKAQTENRQTEPPQTAESVELYVLAAASLTDAMNELAARYESTHPGQKLVISYGSSGTLQKQIEQGAPADLFLSAATKNMKELVDKGLVDPRYTADLLANRLVLVTPKDGKVPIASFEDLTNPDIQKIAIGQPESVPAGQYAKEALMSLKIWDALQPKLVYAKDVRQVLSYVESGNVDAGIVYKTDALSSDHVTLAATAKSGSHSPILYPFGVIRNSKHPEETRSLYDWLRSAEAAEVFAKYGFEPAEAK